MFSAKGKKTKLNPKLEVIKFLLMFIIFANLVTAQYEFKQYDVRFAAVGNKIKNGAFSAAKLLIQAMVLLPTVTGATLYALRIVSLSSKEVPINSHHSSGRPEPSLTGTGSKKKAKKKTGASGKKLLKMLAVMWQVCCWWTVP